MGFLVSGFCEYFFLSLYVTIVVHVVNDIRIKM